MSAAAESHSSVPATSSMKAVGARPPLPPRSRRPPPLSGICLDEQSSCQKSAAPSAGPQTFSVATPRGLGIPAIAAVGDASRHYIGTPRADSILSAFLDFDDGDADARPEGPPLDFDEAMAALNARQKDCGDAAGPSLATDECDSSGSTRCSLSDSDRHNAAADSSDGSEHSVAADDLEEEDEEEYESDFEDESEYSDDEESEEETLQNTGEPAGLSEPVVQPAARVRKASRSVSRGAQRRSGSRAAGARDRSMSRPSGRPRGQSRGAAQRVHSNGTTPDFMLPLAPVMLGKPPAAPSQ